MKIEEKIYDVIIVGGGISGAALFYEICHYTNLGSVALLEKYGQLAELNSNATANSQTIHCGDIETNYTLEKAAKVKQTAKMVEKYCLQYGYEDEIMFKHQKMAIGIGYKECRFMLNRYKEFKELYPYLEVYDKEALAQIEPAIIFDKNGNGRDEEIVGVGCKDEYSTVNFKALTDTSTSTNSAPPVAATKVSEQDSIVKNMVSGSFLTIIFSFFLAGIAAIGSKHSANAVALFELAKLEDPNNFESRYALGLLYLEQGNIRAASIQFGKIPNGIL